MRAAETLAPGELARRIDALRRGFDAADVIYRHKNRVVVRQRAAGGAGPDLILKLWSRPDWRGAARRLLRVTSCEHEYRSLARLERAGVSVPHPYGVARLRPAIAGFTELLAMEDLGQPPSANEHVRRLIAEAREGEVRAFEDAVIEMTGRILAAGIVDVDHGFVNIVVRDGAPMRLDVELARYVGWPRAVPSLYGRMLGHLLALHAFAVQPHTGRTADFAARLRERLDPPARALAAASAYVQLGMRMQRDKHGIDTRVVLPWDQDTPAR